jgi:hypothetical protein
MPGQNEIAFGLSVRVAGMETLFGKQDKTIEEKEQCRKEK